MPTQRPPARPPTAPRSGPGAGATPGPAPERAPRRRLSAPLRRRLALAGAGALLVALLPALVDRLWPLPAAQAPANGLAALGTVLDAAAAAGRGQQRLLALLGALALALLGTVLAWRQARREGGVAGRRALLLAPLLAALLLMVVTAAQAQVQPRPAPAPVPTTTTTTTTTTPASHAMDALHQAQRQAIRSGDAGQALALLARGVDPRRADDNGHTLLHDAVVYSGDLRLVDALLRAGAPVPARDGDGQTPLLAAVAWAHYRQQPQGEARLLAVVDRLLAHGAALDTADRDGRTLAARLLQQRLPRLLQHLLARGLPLPDDALLQALAAADDDAGLAQAATVLRHVPARQLAARDEQGQGAAHLAAAQAARLPLLQALAARGADLRSADHRGLTPYAAAAFAGNLPALRWLAEHGAATTAADTDGQTALHLAAYEPRTELLRWLLDRGADAQARDARGRRPLDIAIDTVRFAERSAEDKLALARLLGGGPADVARGRFARHPLHRAIAARDLRAVEQLLAQGADPNLRDASGHAPLWAALSLCSTLPNTPAEQAFGRQLLPLLLRHGADPQRVHDHDSGTTYLDDARRLRVLDLLEREMRRHPAPRPSR